MQFTTYFTATFATAYMGCDSQYCPCVQAPGANRDSCFNGHCANSFPKGSTVPNC
ncbi:hypothetical protein Vi05172_g7962 [Venturia inaequalis]|nr:hypothetical protein Vi05172_g7962 [Venturia inaequalis]